MAYCRWSEGDVYLYRHKTLGFVCESCMLNSNERAYLQDLESVRAHFIQHGHAGHRVPGSAMERVDQEIRQIKIAAMTGLEDSLQSVIEEPDGTRWWMRSPLKHFASTCLAIKQRELLSNQGETMSRDLSKYRPFSVINDTPYNGQGQIRFMKTGQYVRDCALKQIEWSEEHEKAIIASISKTCASCGVDLEEAVDEELAGKYRIDTKLYPMSMGGEEGDPGTRYSAKAMESVPAIRAKDLHRDVSNIKKAAHALIALREQMASYQLLAKHIDLKSEFYLSFDQIIKLES